MFNRLLAAVATGIIVSMVAAPVVSAQPPSPGCGFLNDPVHDAQYTSSFPQEYDLAAGDRLTMAADEPTAEGNPTAVLLSVDGIIVAKANFPGVVEFEVPASGIYNVVWEVDSGNATWVVGCNAPDCSGVVVSPDTLKADSKLQRVTLSGAAVAGEATVTYAITGVTQDEPTTGGWRQDLKTPDANGLAGDHVSVRGERNPSLNGRVYRISYTATTDGGGSCAGEETVGVPVRRGAAAFDDGDQASWNSFTGELVPAS